MRRLVGILSGTLLTVVGAVVLVAPQAGAVSSSPRLVECVAPDTGAKGPAGAQGATGVAGPQGDTGFNFANGPVRRAHLRGGVNCVDLPILCLSDVYSGNPGAVGPTGATGPKGDTGLPYASDGPARRAHVRGLNLCRDVPPGCVYGVRGPDGDTGLAGATGPKGATGDPEPAPVINGPARGVHRGNGGEAGSVIRLPNCDLPLTGGSTPLLPYALLLVAAGGVVLMMVQRRRHPASR